MYIVTLHVGLELQS